MTEHAHEFASVMQGIGIDIQECRACAARRLELAPDFGLTNLQVWTALAQGAKDGMPSDRAILMRSASFGPFRASWWRGLFRRWV